MDLTVCLRWWFSWAASMNIDFRTPCDSCGFEPKRRCCDGTKIGVGFRNAKFKEISKPDKPEPVLPTIHRRMDRCFLKNIKGIDKQLMAKHPITFDFWQEKN